MAELGRPTVYEGETTCNKVLEYIEQCKDYKEKIVRSSYRSRRLEDRDEDGEIPETETENYDYKFKVKLPTMGGLAVFLGVSRGLIYEWEKTYPEFLRVLEQMRAEQEDRLLNNGLSGDYNSTISKLVLSKHGYREGFEHGGLDGGPIKVEETTKAKIEDALGKLT